MEYVFGVFAWMMTGAVLTIVTWDDERDEWYGALTVNGRWLFFSKIALFWPIVLGYDLLRKRKKEAIEE